MRSLKTKQRIKINPWDEYAKKLKDWETEANKTYPWEPEWVKPNWHQNYEGKKYLQWLEANPNLSCS